MHEVHTSPVLGVLRQAAAEARAMGHRTTDTGHLALSLLIGGGPAARLLAGLGISEPGLRSAARRLHPARTARPPATVVLSWRLRRVLTRAQKTAAANGTGPASPGDLLLALADEGHGWGSRALAEAGASPAAIQAGAADLQDPGPAALPGDTDLPGQT